MNATLESAAQLSTYLAEHEVDPILYGSLGASIYLGAFKQFGDIDLLIESAWLDEQWPELVRIMHDQNFELVDPREHEFRNKEGLAVAFADKSILVRDKIITSPNEIVERMIGSVVVSTLSPEAFRRAYAFSKQDGYRRDVRQKNDEAIIHRLEAYIRDH